MDYAFEDLRGFPVPPQIPDRPEISGGDGDSPTISWNANSEADLDGYKLYRQIDGGSYQLLTSLSKYTTSYTDNEVTISLDSGDPIVNYSVSAFDDLDNESELSLPRGTRFSSISKMISPTQELVEESFRINLFDPYPNPFNPVTNIYFDVPTTNIIDIRIYNALGKEVVVIVHELCEPGHYNVPFDASSLSTGIYILRLRTNQYTSVKKLLYMK